MMFVLSLSSETLTFGQFLFISSYIDCGRNQKMSNYCPGHIWQRPPCGWLIACVQVPWTGRMRPNRDLSFVVTNELAIRDAASRDKFYNRVPIFWQIARSFVFVICDQGFTNVFANQSTVHEIPTDIYWLSVWRTAIFKALRRSH